MGVYSFNKEKVANAVEAAKQTHQGKQNAKESNFNLHDAGCMLVKAECIDVVVENNKVCIELPLGLRTHCISIPIHIPNETLAKACLDICTTWGIPTGVKLTVSVAGVTIISKSFGKC